MRTVGGWGEGSGFGVWLVEVSCSTCSREQHSQDFFLLPRFTTMQRDANSWLVSVNFILLVYTDRSLIYHNMILTQQTRVCIWWLSSLQACHVSGGTHKHTDWYLMTRMCRWCLIQLQQLIPFQSKFFSAVVVESKLNVFLACCTHVGTYIDMDALKIHSLRRLLALCYRWQG